MGKSRKKLAVLLSATMAVSLMTGFTSFAAEETPAAEPQAIVEEAPESAEIPAPAETSAPAETPAPEPAEVPAPAEPPAPEETAVPDETPAETPAPEETAAPDETPAETPVPEETAVPDETPAETPAPEAEDVQDVTETEESVEPEITEGTETDETTEEVPETTEITEEVPATTETTEEAPATYETTEGTDTITPETEEPEIPPTVVYIGDKQITESDEFVAVDEEDESKGEYKYNDGTLVLKDVVIELDPGYGPAINITGTLVIDLEGDNYLTTDGTTVIYAGLWSDSEDVKNTLTITGDGSLTISNKGDGVAKEDQGYADGIYVIGGDLVIDGAEVTSDIYNSGGMGAIWVQDGNVEIKNGADVTAKSTATSDIMEHYGIYTSGGTVTISEDSDVYASADGDLTDFAAIVAKGYPELIERSENWNYDIESYNWFYNMLDTTYLADVDLEGLMAQFGIGIYSEGIMSSEYAEDYPCGIFIDDSNVHAIGSFAAMLVNGLNGTIKINDSTIVSPDGVNVRDLMAVVEDDPDAAAAVIGAILAKGEGPVDIDAIMEEIDKIYEEDGEEGLEAYLTELFDSVAKDVNIVRDAELQTQKAGLGVGEGIPTTGDNFQAEGLLIAMIAAGVVIAYCIRRKVSA